MDDHTAQETSTAKDPAPSAVRSTYAYETSTHELKNEPQMNDTALNDTALNDTALNNTDMTETDPTSDTEMGGITEMSTEMNTDMSTDFESPMDPMITDWEDAAACRSIDNAGALFFSEDIGDIATAKRLCAECPVMDTCLEGALRRREPCGVWGGQLFLNGKMLAQKRRRGRPPKHPRPEDQLPVIPVPEHLLELASA